MSDERMDVEELVDELYELVEKAWNLPLSRGRAMLDVEEVRTILDEIRETMPQEIRQAKAIVADRSQIISDAKREAETIIRVAEERANTLVNQNEIVKQAQQKANEIAGAGADPLPRDAQGFQRIHRGPDEARRRRAFRQSGGASQDPPEHQGIPPLRSELRIWKFFPHKNYFPLSAHKMW